MKQKRLIIVICAAFIAAVAVIAWPRGPKEPEYQGKKLSEWMEIYSRSTNDNQTEAEEAIRAIGTNGVPFLVNYGRSSPRLFRGMLAISARGPRPVSLLAHHYLSRVVALMQLSDNAVLLIGSNAVPVLVEILRDHRNPTEMRCLAAYKIGRLGTSAVGTEDVLRTCINDEKALVASDCAAALGQVASNTTNAIAALAGALKSNREAVRCGAMSGFWSLACRCPIDRRYVAPGLVDTSPSVREMATNVMVKIGKSTAERTNAGGGGILLSP